jgi:regulator of protease activity HflC (stomatin/prohibitin superfamily)
MVFFLKLAVGLLVSLSFILMQAQAGIVEVVNKPFKDLSIKLLAAF